MRTHADPASLAEGRLSKQKRLQGFWCPDERFLDHQPPVAEDLLNLPRAVVDPLVFSIGPEDQVWVELKSLGEKMPQP